MAKRRSKAAIPPPKPAKPKVNTLLTTPTSEARMDPPNHRVPTLTSWSDPFPLLQIEDPLSEDGRRNARVFYDPRYGEHYHDYPSYAVPPTWMDPALLVDMAGQYQDVAAVLATALKKNDADAGRTKLKELLTQVFADDYLPYLMKKFNASVGLLAEWLVANYASRHVNDKHNEFLLKESAKSRRRKGLVASGVAGTDVEDAEEAEEDSAILQAAG
jgi:hypothetical protein